MHASKATAFVALEGAIAIASRTWLSLDRHEAAEGRG
jgi:hypothetical protein